MRGQEYNTLHNILTQVDCNNTDLPQRSPKSPKCPKSQIKACANELKRIRRLTVCRQVVDQWSEEGDEHTGDDDVDDVEQRFAFDDQVEGDVLVLVAVHRDVLVDVSFGRTVNDFPLAIFWEI